MLGIQRPMGGGAICITTGTGWKTEMQEILALGFGDTM